MGPLRIVFCFMLSCFGARASDARRGGLDRCGEGDAEIRLVAPDELSQRGDVHLLSALHAPVEVGKNLEGHHLEIIRYLEILL